MLEGIKITMENKKKKTNDILKQGTILAAASILVRLIGLVYRIPLNDKLGEQGNGIYSIAYKIYSIALIISSYGLPLAVSKMVAAKNVKGEYKNAHKIFVNALIFAMTIGGIVAGVVYFKADFLSGLMGSENASMPLRVLAPTILCVAILGVFRGFFQGQNTMVPTAVSQIFEQIINAVVSIAAAYLFMDMYKNEKNVAAYGATGSTTGTLFGALTALIFMVGVYLANRSVIMRKMAKDTHKADDNKVIYRILLITVIPVILSQVVYQISGTIDSSLFLNMTKNQYSSKVRESMIGAYSGQYDLLINVPLGIATAMGTSMIPSIVSSFTAFDMDEVKYKVKSVIKFNMIIAFPSAVGLAVLGKPINAMLFRNLVTYRDLAANLLFFGSIAIVFFALSTVTTGILQAINKMSLPVIHSAVSLAIHVVLVFMLLKFTNLGIYSLIIGNVTFPLVVCILNWKSVGKYLEYKQEVKTTFVLPAVSALIMGVVSAGTYYGLSAILSNWLGSYVCNLICTLCAVVVAVVVYFVALLILKTVTEEELKTMPMGRTLYVIGRKMHLI